MMQYDNTLSEQLSLLWEDWRLPWLTIRKLQAGQAKNFIWKTLRYQKHLNNPLQEKWKVKIEWLPQAANNVMRAH